MENFDASADATAKWALSTSSTPHVFGMNLGLSNQVVSVGMVYFMVKDFGSRIEGAWTVGNLIFSFRFRPRNRRFRGPDPDEPTPIHPLQRSEIPKRRGGGGDRF